MILDSSAIVATMFQEPGFKSLLHKLADAPTIGIGAPTLVESGIVLSARMGRDTRGLLSRFLEEAHVLVIPFSEAHFGIAMGAWLKYGKGRHPAALNFGDCFAYACAKHFDVPLLYKGNDFARTDIDAA